jgi:hypothetical protein
MLFGALRIVEFSRPCDNFTEKPEDLAFFFGETRERIEAWWLRRLPGVPQLAQSAPLFFAELKAPRQSASLA